MITNGELTIYHKSPNKQTRLEKWTKFNYNNVWLFGGRGAGINKGYENANNVDVRIPYEKNENLDIANFNIGDIIVNEKVDNDIQASKDLKNYQIYYITSTNDNNFGTQPHIHLGGK